MIEDTKILPILQNGNVYLDIIKEGVSPQEIKNALVKFLQIFFDNKEILNNLPDENIGPLSRNIMDISVNNDNLKKLQICLNIFKYAKTIDPNKLYKTLSSWESFLVDSGRKYIHTSLYKVADNYREKEDQIINNIDLIGSFIEGIIKPYLMLQLDVLNICNNKQRRFEEIKILTTGELIDKIKKISSVLDIYKIKGIQINQWRNISHHQSYKVNNNEITCEYGSTLKRKYIVIKKEDTSEIIKNIYDIFAFLKISHEIFYLDNHEYLKPYGNNVSQKKEMRLINLYYGLILKGYELLTYDEKQSMFNATIRSLQDNKANVRIIGEIMVRLWDISKKQNIELNVIEFENKRTLHYETNSSLCEKAYKKQIELEDIILDLNEYT